jgi:hypothetical protein
MKTVEREGAYCSEVGDTRLGLLARAGGKPTRDGPHSIAPPNPDIELAIDVVAVLAGVSLEVVILEDFEFDVLISAECLQHGIETLPRPPEQLAQPIDGDAVVVVAEAVVGGLKLLPEHVGLEEARELLLLVEPGA